MELAEKEKPRKILRLKGEYLSHSIHSERRVRRRENSNNKSRGRRKNCNDMEDDDDERRRRREEQMLTVWISSCLMASFRSMPSLCERGHFLGISGAKKCLKWASFVRSCKPRSKPDNAYWVVMQPPRPVKIRVTWTYFVVWRDETIVAAKDAWYFCWNNGVTQAFHVSPDKLDGKHCSSVRPAGQTGPRGRKFGQSDLRRKDVCCWHDQNQKHPNK